MDRMLNCTQLVISSQVIRTEIFYTDLRIMYVRMYVVSSSDPCTSSPDMENDEQALAQLLQVIARLPEANKDTLAFLILHLLT